MGREHEGRLVSRSCTTGALDWIHGELWLFDDRLLRVRLDYATSADNGLGPTVPADAPRRLFTDEERERIATAHRTNLFLAWADVRGASLRRGFLMGRLRVTLHDGSRRKLLWLARDPAHDALRALLPAHASGS